MFRSAWCTRHEQKVGIMFRSLQRSIVLVSLGKREFAKLLNEIFSYFFGEKKKWKFTFKLSETNFLSLNNYFTNALLIFALNILVIQNSWEISFQGSMAGFLHDWRRRLSHFKTYYVYNHCFPIERKNTKIYFSYCVTAMFGRRSSF